MSLGESEGSERRARSPRPRRPARPRDTHLSPLSSAPLCRVSCRDFLLPLKVGTWKAAGSSGAAVSPCARDFVRAAAGES